MSDLTKYRISELPDSVFYIPGIISSSEEMAILNKIYSSPKPKWRTLSNRRLQNWGGLPHSKGMIQEKLPDWLEVYIKKICNLGVFESLSPNHVLINEYLPGQGIMPHEDGPLFYPTIATINLGSHTVLDYYDKPFQIKSLENENNSNVNRESKCERVSREEDAIVWSGTNDASGTAQVEDIVEDCKVITKNNGSTVVGSLLLERRSLLVVKDQLYSEYLHGIKHVCSDEIDKNIKNLHLIDTQIRGNITREKRISLTVRFVPHTIKSKFVFGVR